MRWKRQLSKGNNKQRKQNSASPSPVTDGKHVWVVTGTGAVTAFDIAGKLVGSTFSSGTTADSASTGATPSSPLLHDGN